jgi:hypothetical protein
MADSRDEPALGRPRNGLSPRRSVPVPLTKGARHDQHA